MPSVARLLRARDDAVDRPARHAGQARDRLLDALALRRRTAARSDRRGSARFRHGAGGSRRRRGCGGGEGRDSGSCRIHWNVKRTVAQGSRGNSARTERNPSACPARALSPEIGATASENDHPIGGDDRQCPVAQGPGPVRARLRCAGEPALHGRCARGARSRATSTRRSAKALAKKPDLLILGGGDGTISGLVDHLVGTDTALGVLPLGTANSFARTLGIPLDRRRARSR